jgi:hypothetical protein
MKKLILTSCLALGLTSGLFATTITPNVLLGGGATGVTKIDLNGDGVAGPAVFASSGLTISGTGDAKLVNGSQSGEFAAPYLSGNNDVGFGGSLVDGYDSTRYLTTGTGTITFQFDSYQNYFGLLWGSVDNYNSLAFYDGVNLLGTLTGSNAYFSDTTGNQGKFGTFYVNINTDVLFNRVVASSGTSYAFELDNVAFGRVSVPDSGATVALLGLSFGCLFFFRRKAA